MVEYILVNALSMFIGIIGAKLCLGLYDHFNNKR